MPDISTVTLLDKKTYNLKDLAARNELNNIPPRTYVKATASAYYRFAYIDKKQDIDGVFLIRAMYDGGPCGIIKISKNQTVSTVSNEDEKSTTTENEANVLLENSFSANWLVRMGLDADAVWIGDGDDYADVFVCGEDAQQLQIILLSSKTQGWLFADNQQTGYPTLDDAANKLHGKKYNIQTCSYDAGIVEQANNAKKVNNHTVESDVPRNVKFAYGTATQASDGLMSAADKKTVDQMTTRLDNIAILAKEFKQLQANAIVVETYSAANEDLTTLSGISDALNNLRTHMIVEETA